MSEDLARLDLNLLLPLEALLSERNVTKAAARLGITQPAASAALARLRRYFDDELLVRVGTRYDLTPLGTQLRASAATAIASARKVFDTSRTFDPASSDRTFTVVMSDYATLVLGPLMSQDLERTAPGVQLNIEPITSHTVDNIDETLRRTDAVVLPLGIISDHPHVELFHDRWVGVVAEDNVKVGRTSMSRKAASTVTWVLAHQGPTAFTPADMHLRQMGLDLRPAVTVQGFLALPFMVQQSSRAGIIQKRLARRLDQMSAVRTVKLPFDPPRIVVALWWHQGQTADAGHSWFRSWLVAVAARS